MILSANFRAIYVRYIADCLAMFVACLRTRTSKKARVNNLINTNSDIHKCLQFSA